MVLVLKMKGLVSRQTLSNLKSNTMKNTHKGSYFFVKNKSSLPKSCDCILFKLLLPFERANCKWHNTKKNIILMDCYKQNVSRDEKTRTSDLHVPNVARYQLCYIPMRIRGGFAYKENNRSSHLRFCKGSYFFFSASIFPNQWESGTKACAYRRCAINSPKSVEASFQLNMLLYCVAVALL